MLGPLNVILWNGQKKGGEINGSKRAEEGRIKEASPGRSTLPHIPIWWFIKEKVIVYI
jgi:hypothetical protein